MDITTLTPSSIFLLAAALFLAVISFTIVLALYSEKHRDRIVGFLLEGSTEAKGKPSLSRLQMLIWNVVVAFGFLYILANVSPDAVEVITATTLTVEGKDVIVEGKLVSKLGAALSALLSPQILILLGVSNATYLLGKVTRPGTPPADQEDDPESVKTLVKGIPTNASPPPPAGAPPMG